MLIYVVYNNSRAFLCFLTDGVVPLLNIKITLLSTYLSPACVVYNIHSLAHELYGMLYTTAGELARGIHTPTMHPRLL